MFSYVSARPCRARRRVLGALAGPQVAKKLHHDAFPATLDYSDRSHQASALHTVGRVSEYKTASKPDDDVPADFRVPCFRARAAWECS